VAPPATASVAAKPDRPPGPKGGFVFGNTFDYRRDPLTFLTRCAREHGDVARFRIADTPVYLISDPELVDEVLRSHGTRVIKDKFTRLICPIVGQGLVTSEGEFWKRQRKLTMPAFQHQAIERYGREMVDLSRRVRDSWKDGEEVAVHDAMMGLTLAIVAKTLFGAEVSAESHDVGTALEIVMEHHLSVLRWFPLFDHLPTRGNRMYREALRRIDEVMYGIIARRRAQKDDPGDLLGRFLAATDDEGAGMTDLQLRDECVTLFLAGHETTALTLSFAFYLLAENPEVDARLSAELNQVLDGRPPSANDMGRLPYTEAVVRESMRLYPPAWVIGRETTEDLELGGYRLKTGSTLFLSQWVVHRDPRFWDEPERFRPERWENELARRLPRGVYFPFGGGPRVCIGNHFAMLEAVLLLATLCQEHRLTRPAGQALELAPSITLRPRGGLPMKVERRPKARPSV
jgi:cytochrome P450